jgi:hypothetical protein
MYKLAKLRREKNHSWIAPGILQIQIFEFLESSRNP